LWSFLLRQFNEIGARVVEYVGTPGTSPVFLILPPFKQTIDILSHTMEYHSTKVLNKNVFVQHTT